MKNHSDLKPILRVHREVCARVPTAAGEFQLCLYSNNRDQKEHMAFVYGDVQNREQVPVRIHSECFTGDVLGSQRCDCGEQLQWAMQYIAQQGFGCIVYLRQEGRGIGLAEKLRAYNLQDKGLDTVEANLALGHPVDERRYDLAAAILADLGVRSIDLLTNNPAKIDQLEDMGIPVTGRVPVLTTIYEDNALYLQTKVERMNHLIDLAQSNREVGGDDLEWAAAWVKQGRQEATAAGRMLVTLTYAQSLDGSITATAGQPTGISGENAMRFTHTLRANHDAILIGVGAALADNPRLTVRLVEGPSPQPVILDTQLRLPLTARLYEDQARAPWIFTKAGLPVKNIRAHEQAGAKVFAVAETQPGMLDLTEVLQILFNEGIRSLMVEGGSRVITSFLRGRFAHQVAVTVAPIFTGGLNSVVDSLNQAGCFPSLADMELHRIGKDLILLGKTSEVRL